MNKVVSLISVLVLVLGFAGVTNAESKPSVSKTESSVVIERVNINTADAAALAQGLHRVGPKTAEAIVEWRTSNGKFSSKEQLMEVKGIGEATLKANQDRIVL